MAATAPFVWGSAGERLTPDQVERKRKLAEALGKQGMDYSPVQHWTQGAARVAQALLGGWEEKRAGDAEKANTAEDAAIAASLLGGIVGGGSPIAAAPASAPASAPSMAGGGAARTMAMPNVSPEIKDGIVQTASALGIDPVDLATTISYETGGTFDPTKAGPTTKWGQHRGLIQFGEPQAKQHGVDWANPVASQLGPNGAVASYLRTAGVKPGMGLLDVYSAINAGAPGLYDRSDAAAGGAPGTVRDKVERQMAGHRAKAQALFADLPAPGASPVAMESGQPGFAIPGQPAPMTGQTFNAIHEGRPLDPVFQSEGLSQPWMGSTYNNPAAMAPQVAQMPLPPPRPADLAMPQADMPAPGAVPAIGQMPAAVAPEIDPNSPDAGVRAQIAANAQGASASPFAGIAQALTGGQGQAAATAAPTASPAVQQVAAAVAQNPSDPLVRALTSPAASDGTKKIAMALLLKKIEGDNKSPIAVGKDQRLVDPRTGRIILERDRNASDVKRSLTPVYGTDAQGNTVLLQPGDDGSAVQTKLPAGVKISAGVDKIDAGTEWILTDKRTGQVVGRQAKDIAGAEGQKIEGKAAAEAKIDLPSAIAKAEQSLATIEAIRNHPGRNQFGATGWGSQLPIIGDGTPGTKARDFVGLVEQMKGKAFLEAFGELKGGGAISEGEGSKATAAIARLDRAQSKEGFDAALKDIEDVVRAGIERAKRKAGVAGSAPSAPAPGGWNEVAPGVRIREKR